VITSIFRRLATPVVVLAGGIMLSGCSGEEKIPLKKVDFVLDAPPKDFKETRKAFSEKGRSSKIGKDPFGISKAPASGN
jgi:hypothetical protein